MPRKKKVQPNSTDFVFNEKGEVQIPVLTPQMETTIKNGLMDAIFGGGSLLGFGDNNNLLSGFNTPGIGTPLNRVDTMWINNRWYKLTNYRQLLSESYCEHGIIQTLVNVPVDDGLRGGILIKSKELDPVQIEELSTYMEEEGDLNAFAQTCKWNRLFGGAGTVLITDQDPEAPLDIKKITRLRLRACDMWELFWNKQNTEDYSIALDTVSSIETIEYFNYYGHHLHKSRVFKQKGIEAPSLIRPQLRGWGLSVCEVLVNSINNYLKANNLIFEVLDEFKIDYFKIKNLANSVLTQDGEMAVRKRIWMANRQKNYQGAVTMDSEDDFIQKELSFAGLAETQVGIRMQIASDMRMPMAKVFGISSQGFGSGQDDIENYNAMVESSIRTPNKFDLMKLVQIRCYMKFGFIPDDLKLEFKPLRVLSAEQEETVKTHQMNRLSIAMDKGTIDLKEFREAINQSNLLPIQLETDDAMIAKLESAKEENRQFQKESKLPGGNASSKESTLKAPDVRNSTNPEKEDIDDMFIKRYLALPETKAKDLGEISLSWKSLNSKEKSLLTRFMGLPQSDLEDLNLEAVSDYDISNIDNPGKVDEAKWQKAKDASKKAFGKVKWPFVTWWYKEHGGTFN
jgi:uncharacterized protein